MDTTDRQLRASLKNWVSKHPLPANGRARILGGAAFSKKPKIERSTPFEFTGIPNELLSWATVYSLDRGVGALRLVS